MKYRAEILMHPVPKARPRVGQKAHTPKETKDAEKLFAYLYKSKCKTHPDYIGNVCLLVEVHTIKGRGDLDNYVKLVSDALNGLAWKDDRQVTEIHAKRIKDEPEGYYVEVTYL